MFGSNKKTNQGNQPVDFSKIYSEIDNAPLHTMQDDVNALQGIIPPQNIELVVKPIDRAPEMPNTQKTSTFQPSPNTQKTPSNSHYSPFLNPAGPAPESKNVKPPTEDRLITKPDIGPKRHIKWNKVLIILMVVLAFSAVSFGGYYFWLTRKPEPEPQPVEKPVDPQPTPPVTVEPQTKKYSIDNPNILQINTNATATEIKQLLVATGSELKAETPDAPPVEFIIRDEKNNPIDFSIFSILVALKLDYALDYLGEDFSFYLYPDNGNMRAGIAIKIDDKGGVQKAMLANEKTLVSDVSSLFLDSQPSKISKPAFSEGLKDGYLIRYVNLDTELEGALSVDYVVTDNLLIIATSKNSSFEILNLVSKKGTNSSQ